MEMVMKPTLMKRKFFTPGVIFLTILAINGLVFLAIRFIGGLGAVTNLDNYFPWGIWIGVDVAAGVALAAGGFTSSALGHIMHREHFHVVVRPALLTAMLGYTFVAFAVVVDIGRFYYVWHPLIMWNGNSALFEVGICVMTYMTVLYIEFLPVLVARFAGKVNLTGVLAFINKPAEMVLKLIDRTFNRVMFIFIIAGVVLSCLHQSSLGTLMIISGPKLHPLWQTPVLPLLFLISAISVGFPMVMMESILASRSFGLKPEVDVLSRLARMVGPMLGIYLAFKIGDMAVRQTHVYLMSFSTESVMYILEVVIGIIIPLRLFFTRRLLRSPGWLLTASLFVIAGVLINRINVFIIAYTPPYADHFYFPAVGEISVTVGFVALEVLAYRWFVKNFPIISIPDTYEHPGVKYKIKG
jgi:Ni/Fe-hydrogenase subunit HybB-like protein